MVIWCFLYLKDALSCRGSFAYYIYEFDESNNIGVLSLHLSIKMLVDSFSIRGILGVLTLLHANINLLIKDLLIF